VSDKDLITIEGGNLMDSPLPVGEFLDRASKRLKTDMAADEIERLRAELAAAIKQRDEARREVCNMTTFYNPHIAEAKEVAAKRGWDCYEEGGGA